MRCSIGLLSNRPTKQLCSPVGAAFASRLKWLGQLEIAATVCNTSTGVLSGSNKRGDLCATDVETGKLLRCIKKAHRYTCLITTALCPICTNWLEVRGFFLETLDGRTHTCFTLPTSPSVHLCV